jgi:NAD(P)-dependent dehydrogenase (short-subunit alcohol dehydrogenase family)
MSERLRGKAALITGSTSNIGKAIAIRFAAEGAWVVVTGRDAGRGRAVVEAIQAAGGEATFLRHELDGSVEGSRELAELATNVYGSIDILVNNAGIYPPGGTLAIDGDTFDRIMAVNVKAPYFLTAALVPAMAAAGRGVVLNLGSWGARLGIPLERPTPRRRGRWKRSPARGLQSSVHRGCASTRSLPASLSTARARWPRWLGR